jgi:hypothetical protein
MKTLGRILFFIAILLLSALAVLLLLLGMKEGISWSETPFYFAGAAGLILVGVLWWLACGRSWTKATIGWVMLAAPILASLATGLSLIAAQLRGLRLPDQVTIESYRETPITWPGFEGAVGLRVELMLAHPENTEGLIHAPEIRMGPALSIVRDRLFASYTLGGGYFKDAYADEEVGDLVLMKTVLHQRLYEPRFASIPFEPGPRSRLTYHLYPGTLELLDSETRLCLASETYGIALCEADQAPSDGCAPLGRTRVTQPT